MFCVVKTSEMRGVVFTAVPCNWVDGTNLRWPPKTTNKRDVEMWQKSASTKPTSKWGSLPCIVKSMNIESFEKANALVDVYIQYEDTEDEER